MFSRYLRNNSTFAEVLLWNELKAKKMMGYAFNRQKPLGNYIVDFYCKELKLAIEVDGSSHYNEEAHIKDEKRQLALEKLGLSFLRFDDEEVRKDMGNVLRSIEGWIIERNEMESPCPLKKGDNLH